MKPISELLEFSIMNIDKPSGPTSFDVSHRIMRMLGLRKTSHFGTLDPKVTGVLPVGLNRACKLSDYFMHKDKTYVGIMHLHEDVSLAELKEEMKKFVGKIMQLPPQKSNVKRIEREREVKMFEIIEKDGRDVVFLAEVEAGTYIRKLIHDLGGGVGGAHMLELRRTKAGIFSERDENFVNMYELEGAVDEYKKGDETKLRKILIPAEKAIKKVLAVAEIEVSDNELKQILTGKPLLKRYFKQIPNKKRFAVFVDGRFVEVARKVDEGEIVARAEFVFN